MKHPIEHAHGLDLLGLDPMNVAENLQIEHTDEDCKLSRILASATGRTLLVEDRIVFLFETDHAGQLSHILRMEISASDRRKLLAGNPGTVKLRPPGPGNRIEDMDQEKK